MITGHTPIAGDASNVSLDTHFRSDSLDGVLPPPLANGIAITENQLPCTSLWYSRRNVPVRRSAALGFDNRIQFRCPRTVGVHPPRHRCLGGRLLRPATTQERSLTCRIERGPPEAVFLTDRGMRLPLFSPRHGSQHLSASPFRPPITPRRAFLPAQVLPPPLPTAAS